MDIDSLEPGLLVTDEVVLVAEAKLQVDRRGQNYYSLTLNTDGGRRIEGKVWADNIAAAIEPGQGLEILARVDEYRGKKQFNIQRYKVLEPHEYDVAALVRTTDVDVEAAFETLFDWSRDEFTSPVLRPLMAEFHGNAAFAAQFKSSPAASFHHHNYRGGLIEHTLEVWRLAETVGALYAGRLDRELLLCAAALHDVGKTRCYRLTPGVSEPTDAGTLLDHIFISASMVSNLWDSAVRPGIDAERAAEGARTKALLLHLILSHHGKLEWGSPVLPRTPEAVLLHHCDVVSANLHVCLEAVAETPDSECWTDDVYIMDQRRRLFVPRPGAARDMTGDADE